MIERFELASGHQLVRRPGERGDNGVGVGWWTKERSCGSAARIAGYRGGARGMAGLHKVCVCETRV